MDKETPSKSRVLPLPEFYSILQQEYVCYLLRTKIYPLEYSEKYINYCKMKKIKIETISLRNSLPSIFKSEAHYKKYLDKILNEFGLPNFEYRDEKSRSIMGFWDKIYWFDVGSKINVKIGEELKEYIVIRNLPLDLKVIAVRGGLTATLDYCNISKVMDENFLKIN